MIVLELGPDASAPRIARQAVHDALAGYSVDARDVAVLLVDELVTNALVHGHGQIGLRVEDSPDWIRVRVSDSDSSLPILQRPSPVDERGRGSMIVDALASAWGVDRTPNGKTIWFQLDLA